MNKIILFVLAVTLIAAGAVFADQKQDKEAILSELSAYADKDPIVLTGAIFSIGDAYIRQNKIEEAIALYEKALNILPDNEDLLSRAGNIYNQKMSYDKAIAVYKKLAALKPDNAWYSQMLTNALNMSGKKDEAADIWKKLVADKPEDANVLSQAAIFYNNTNDIVSALPLAEKAAKLDAGNIGYLQNLANLYVRAEKLDKAEETYKKVLDTAKDAWLKDWANGELLNVYQKQNRLDEVLAKLEGELKASPDDASKNKVLAELYVRKGDNEKALVVYEKLTTLVSNDRNVMGRLVDLYEGAGKFNDATIQLEKVIKIAPGEPYLFERLANLYERAGKKDEAKKAWESMVSKVTTDPSVYSRYAEALYKMGDFNGAVTQIKKAQAMDVGNLTYALRSAAMLVDAGKIEEAKVILGKVSLEAKEDWIKNEAKRKLEEIANIKVEPKKETPVVKVEPKNAAPVAEVKKEAAPQQKEKAPAKKKGLFSR